MGNLSITEYRGMADGAPVRSPLAEQAVEFATEAVSSKPFATGTHAIMVVSDSSCSLAFGGTSAVPGLHRLPANRERLYPVEPNTTISVVADQAAAGADLIEASTAMLRVLANFTDAAAMEKNLAALRAAETAARAAEAAAKQAIAEEQSAKASVDEMGARVTEQGAALLLAQEKLAADRAALTEARGILLSDRTALHVAQQVVADAEAAVADKIASHKRSLDEDHAARTATLGEQHDAKLADLDERRAELEEATNRSLAELNGLKAEAARATAAAKAREEAAAEIEASYKAKMADIDALTARLRSPAA